MNRVMKVTTRERTKTRERESAHEDLASSLLFFVLFSCSKESRIREDFVQGALVYTCTRFREDHRASEQEFTVI